MNQFYNPYQFIPVTGEINGNKERTAYADVAAGRHAHARHDLWQKNGASGRILCSLRLHTPTIVGARQTGQPPKRVAGYSWRGKHAIPGNSLKGMIGSIAEALSQSTLRVLDKHEEVPKTRPPKRWTVGLPVQGQNRPVPHPVKVDTHRYFARIDQDMVPWRRSSGQTQRDRLTPAELLFGLVEDIESGVSNDPGRNLAGRVRFHDALPLTGDGETDPEITLKILASPYLTGDKKAGKQCVPFYFHKRGQRGGYIGKRAFYQAEHNDDILPNGRKFYLQHHRPAFPGHSDWAAAADYDRKTAKQRLRCAPLRAGQTFLFHIDFDNLSPAELTLLECALAPAPNFRHRLGLGKPLGLGSVSISIEAVLPIHRHNRYAPETFIQHRRWQTCWRPADSPQSQVSAAALPATYAAEAAALQAAVDTAKPARYEDRSLIDRQTLAILSTLGDLTKLDPDAPVRTPFEPTQASQPEGKSYAWFNDNDEHGGQALRAVQPGQSLPVLYSDYRDAHRARVCFDADVGAVATDEPSAAMEPAIATWLQSIRQEHRVDPDDPEALSKFLITAPAATSWLNIEDPDARQRVLRWWMQQVRQRDPETPMFNLLSKAAMRLLKRNNVDVSGY